jgi:hypothetical protein
VNLPVYEMTPLGHNGTVQTVDLILLRIGRIPQLHFCIEKKILLKSLCWLGGKFMLRSLQANWNRAPGSNLELDKKTYTKIL